MQIEAIQETPTTPRKELKEGDLVKLIGTQAQLKSKTGDDITVIFTDLDGKLESSLGYIWIVEALDGYTFHAKFRNEAFVFPTVHCKSISSGLSRHLPIELLTLSPHNSN